MNEQDLTRGRQKISALERERPMLAQARNWTASEVHLGDARFSIAHPASTSHRQLSDAQQVFAGAAPEAARLSIGMETADDLIRDLDQALDARV